MAEAKKPRPRMFESSIGAHPMEPTTTPEIIANLESHIACKKNIVESHIKAIEAHSKEISELKTQLDEARWNTLFQHCSRVVCTLEHSPFGPFAVIREKKSDTPTQPSTPPTPPTTGKHVATAAEDYPLGRVMYEAFRIYLVGKVDVQWENIPAQEKNLWDEYVKVITKPDPGEITWIAGAEKNAAYRFATDAVRRAHQWRVENKKAIDAAAQEVYIPTREELAKYGTSSRLPPATPQHWTKLHSNVVLQHGDLLTKRGEPFCWYCQYEFRQLSGYQDMEVYRAPAK